MTNYVQRPWVSYFTQLIHSNSNLEQQCKLIRNQIASLDLGFPHFKLYDSHYTRDGQRRLARPNDRESYLEWVADWKRTYRELSRCIHSLKTQRTLAGTAREEQMLRKANPNWDNLSSHALFDSNTRRIREATEKLALCAQVMLNARYVGKLASAELRRRRLAEKGTITDASGPVAELV